MIATLMAGLGFGAGIALLLTRLRWRLPKAESGAPAGLAGWLVLPIIGVWISPFVLAYSIVNWFHDLGAAVQFAAAAANLRWMLLLQFGVLSATIVVSVMTVVLLFRRARTFPFAFIALQVLGLSILVIDMASLFVLGDSLESTAYKNNPLPLRTSVAALWIVYMFVSQRVRATFVSPWRSEPAAPVEPAAAPTTAAPVGA
jgi:hypothetical protein